MPESKSRIQELGNPSNPPKQPGPRSTPGGDRPGCQSGQEEEAVQATSNCAESTLQDKNKASVQECRLQSLPSSSRPSNKKSAPSSEHGGTSSTPVVTLEFPSRNPGHSKALPYCTVGSDDPSATSEPVTSSPDPSNPQTLSVSSATTVPRGSASRDKETQQLLALLGSCKPARVKKNPSFQK